MKTCRPPRWEPCRCTKWHHPTQGRQRLSEEWSVHQQTFCAEPLHLAPKLVARLCSLLRPRQQPSVRNSADATRMCLRTFFHHSKEVSSGLPFLMTLDFARCCANIGYKKVRPSFLNMLHLAMQGAQQALMHHLTNMVMKRTQLDMSTTYQGRVSHHLVPQLAVSAILPFWNRSK